MSLESQLHEKADKEFHLAYRKLFDDFEAGLRALTGSAISDGYGKPLIKQTAAFLPLLALRYAGSTDEARAVYDGVRDLYREKYVANFLRLVEEMAAYAGTTTE